MTAFTGDASLMDCNTLMMKLQELVDEYDAKPHLASDNTYALRQSELISAIRVKCSKACRIDIVKGTTSQHEILCEQV